MINYALNHGIATISMDDGKTNVFGHEQLEAFAAALDKAQEEAKAVIIAGRDGFFTSGLDLKVMKQGPEQMKGLLTGAARLALRILEHPQPVIVASAGHSVALGPLIKLASDVRISAEGEYKIGLNETAIGVTLPPFAIELAKAGVPTQHQLQVILGADLYRPQQAMEYGLLDEVVAASELEARALAVAKKLSEYPASAYSSNKRSMRRNVIDVIKASLAD